MILEAKETRDEIESTNNKDIKKQLKHERNISLKETKNLLKTEQTAIMDEELKEIESRKKIPINTTNPSLELTWKNPKSHSRSMTITSL